MSGKAAAQNTWCTSASITPKTMPEASSILNGCAFLHQNAAAIQISTGMKTKSELINVASVSQARSCITTRGTAISAKNRMLKNDVSVNLLMNILLLL